MARVTDRGQLLLAGAFVLAVTLIGLTLVFSASDYTAVLADEESGITQGTDAIGARESVRADLASGLRAVHDEYGTGNYETEFKNLLPRLGTETRDYYARHGRLVNVSDPAFSSGWRIAQPSDDLLAKPGTRTDPNPDPNWDVATGTTARNMTVVFSDVPDPTDPEFEIQFGTDWVVKVYEDSSGDWKVTVNGPSYSATCTRSGTGSPMTVDVSGATVDGDHCEALTALSPGTGYDVEFDNGHEAEGRFWLTVTDSASFPEIGPMDTNPEREEVIYDVTVDYRYQSSAVDYETEIRVAPGEIE